MRSLFTKIAVVTAAAVSVGLAAAPASAAPANPGAASVQVVKLHKTNPERFAWCR